MAARMVYQIPKCSHITPYLTELHWLPVEYRIQFKVILHTFKGLHKLAPVYICNMFKLKSSPYSLRSNGAITLVILKTTCKTLEDRSLAVAGPTLWNNLPESLRSMDNLDQFKAELKTFLFRKAFF